ncbi:MAG: PD-(D/E)XK nuclease family protein [Chloroflexi bacterium]|nr:PD-(D/E)XK nuclease family protein [Chloroflexota bacterium]
MTTEIVLAPAATGKTEQALERLLHVVGQPLAPVWVLVASARQEDAFRARLMQMGNKQVYFNIEFFDFFKLYARILNIAGQPVRALDSTGRYRLLRAVLQDLQRRDELRHFHSIAHTPGFVHYAADFLYELKSNVVYPEVFAAAARTHKDRELAQIYHLYQDKLKKHDLVDREGEGWLALEALQNDDQRLVNRQPLQLHLPLALLLIDGFDQFTSLQARLIARLAGRAGQALITLTTVTAREDTIGRRFAQALERLKESYKFENQPQPTITLLHATPAEDRRPADMRHLLAHIFRNSAPKAPAQGQISLIEAPDSAREVAEVLRRVKRLLLAGCPPDDILIALRDWSSYSPHILTTMRLYGLPLALHYGEPLHTNAAIVALLGLLQLHERDFQRREVFDTLRSPYFTFAGLDVAHIDQLEKTSHALVIVGGRALWLEALDEAPHVREDADDDQAPPLLPEASAALLKTHLAAFFEAVTPPPQAAVDEYVRWLEALIGPDPTQAPDEGPDPNLPANPLDSAPEQPAVYRLHLLANVRGAGRGDVPRHIVSRDLSALRQLKRVLRGLLSAQQLLKSLGEDHPVTWAEFFSDLRAALESTTFTPAPNRSGRVLVTTAANARGLPHQHVFILGLAEGLFPQRQPEDPLYTDAERRAFYEQHNIPLLTRAERASDDGLFYELIGLPRATLTLSRPYLQEGKLWIESHLWRAVTRLFDDLPLEKVRAGEVVPVQEAASRQEVALALAEAFHGQSQPVAAAYNWLLTTDGDSWARIRQGRELEARRMARKFPHDRYSGRLDDPRLLAFLQQELGPQRVWSASQLNEFGQCAFRFFAKRLLQLEALEEPEEGVDALVLGSIYHKILENTYKRVLQQGMTITPEHVEAALAFLDEEADKVLAAAPRQLHFRASAVWEGEQRVLRRRLHALVRKDFSADSPLNTWGEAPRVPFKLEMPFGTLALELDDGERLRVRGYIDRVDRQGDAAVIVDYKSGSRKIPVSEIENGRNFQMMLYVLALEHVLRRAAGNVPQNVAGGVFWHVRSAEASGQLSPADAAVAAARQHLTRYLQAARDGNFAVHPTKVEEGKCTRYCEFAQLCRMSTIHRDKPHA